MTTYELILLQRTPADELPRLKEILAKGKDEILWALANAYLYGVMQGKRAERARRKARSIKTQQ